MREFFRFILPLILMCLCLELSAARWASKSTGIQVIVDTEVNGGIKNWLVGGDLLIGRQSALENEVPVLQLVSVDGARSTFRPVAHSTEELEGSWRLSVDGLLEFSPATVSDAGKYAIKARIEYLIRDEGKEIAVRVGFEPSGAAETLQVSSLSWSQPLNLNYRKRVYYLGNNETDWETRYFFQYTVDPRGRSPMLPVPERNEWRYFSLDYLGGKAFRLWKSESHTTSPLVMEESIFGAPLVQVYDEERGVVLEYPDFAKNPEHPRSIKVDAAGRGRLSIDFKSNSTIPATLGEILAAGKGTLEDPFEFVLSGYNSTNDLISARADYKERYSSMPHVSPEQSMQEAEWLQTASLPSEHPSYVTGGYPFPQGEVMADEISDYAAVQNGQTLSTQAKPLAYWPDGSIKWALFTFPFEGSSTDTSVSGTVVTLRTGEEIPVEIRRVESAAQVSPTTVLSVEEDRGVVKITNGDMVLELGPGAAWLRSLVWRNRPMLDVAPTDRLAYTDFLVEPEEVLPFALSATGGRLNKGSLNISDVMLEESGPLRAVVRLEGMTDDEEPTRIIMRVELLAGRPEIKITHSAEFLFKDPRRTFLTGMGFELPLSEEIFSGAAGRQTLLKLSPQHLQIIGDESEQIEMFPEAGALSVYGDGVTLTTSIRYFGEMTPKALAADMDSGKLRVELWPSEAFPMDVRRYSNYPHRGQLESVPLPADERWVPDTYYTQDPFKGVSRTHEVLLTFSDGATDRAEAIAADFQSPPLLYAGWDRYEDTGVVMPSVGRNEWPKAWEGWTRLTNFWLWHRERNSWKGFWSYGDLRHRFRTHHYGFIFEPDVLKKRLEGKEVGERKRDYLLSGDWAFDNGSNGWTNTEGLPNLFLQHEYLRNGNRAVYFAAEALARHSRDVVTRHDGIWFGKGTRHGVQHWSGANHEERQTTVTEYRLHYFLSGEGRSRDVVSKLYDQYYSKTSLGRHAGHSGRLGGLFFHLEITGDKSEEEQFRQYVKSFVASEGIYLSPNVRFPGGVRHGEGRDLNSPSMFLHTFGGMHALLEYYELTHDEELAEGLIKMADVIITRPIIENRRLGNGDFSWPPVAFAARYAENPEPYRAFLKRYVHEIGWRPIFQTVTENPQHWTGDTGMMVSTPTLNFSWQNWAGYVIGALASDQIWTPEIEEGYNKFEASGGTRYGGAVSWQSEFDGVPEFEEYLGPQQPWRTKSDK